MPIANFLPPRRPVPALLIALFLLLGLMAVWPGHTEAQHAENVAPAQIGSSSPLPVFVTNAPILPDGFVPGSTWRFTTWTTPSVFTWTARIERISGPWAYLTVKAEEGTTTSRWYYVPAMPGSWEPQ